MVPPPPPPPRGRGGSRGSQDGPPGISRRQSGDSVRLLGTSVVEEPVAEEDEAPHAGGPEQPAKAEDILADLDALRREVDALRGKFGEGGAP